MRQGILDVEAGVAEPNDADALRVDEPAPPEELDRAAVNGKRLFHLLELPVRAVALRDVLIEHLQDGDPAGRERLRRVRGGPGPVDPEALWVPLVRLDDEWVALARLIVRRIIEAGADALPLRPFPAHLLHFAKVQVPELRIQIPQQGFILLTGRPDIDLGWRVHTLAENDVGISPLRHGLANLAPAAAGFPIPDHRGAGRRVLTGYLKACQLIAGPIPAQRL